MANHVTQTAHIQEMEKETSLLDRNKCKATFKRCEHKED